MVVCGPTAVGKSAFALSLAEKLNIEIISADAIQVYKALNIGTAKPSKQELTSVPHHMIDIISPLEEFNVALFTAKVKEIIRQIWVRNALPVIVGGTGFYIEGLLNNYSFDNIDGRRQEMNKTSLDVTIVCLNKERAQLYAEIDSRVDQMMEKGLLDEVKVLRSIGAGEGAQSMQAIGYKEFVPYLNNEISLATAIANVKQNSRNYAKRQLTWFRGMQGIRWINMPEERVQALQSLITEFDEYKKTTP